MPNKVTQLWTFSVPLRTGTCYMYIRGIFVLFLQDYCALKMNFTLVVAQPFVHPMTSLLALPIHSVRKYGFLSEPTRRRQVAKYGNLDPSCNKCCDLIGHTRVSILHRKPCTSVENLVKLCKKPCNSYRKPCNFMSKGTEYIVSC